MDAKIQARAAAIGDQIREAFPGRIASIDARLAPEITVDWVSPPTEQEQQQLAAILPAFDWRPRRPRAASAILADFDTLTAAQWRTRMTRLATYLILHDPELARRAMLMIEADEPEE